MTDVGNNVLLVVLDTARARNISTYGYERETTSGIDSLAEDGIVYGPAISPSPWTLPSHASMLTGRYVSNHGVRSESTKLDSGLPYLPTLLSERDFETWAVSSNSWVSPEFGFDMGFDTFISSWKLFQTELSSRKLAEESIWTRFQKYTENRAFVRSILNVLYRQLYFKRYDYGGWRNNFEVKKLISNGGELFFGFINYMEPHLEYGPPKFQEEFLPDDALMNVNQNPWRYIFNIEDMSNRDFEVLEALYDAELRYADSLLCDVICKLKSIDEYENTLIIVTSDHGENIGDHGFMDHQYNLYNTLLKTPLVIKYPGGERPDCRELVSQIDILPTVLDVLDIDTTVDCDGWSLIDNTRNWESRYILSEYLSPMPGPESIRENYPEADETVLSAIDQQILSIQNATEKLIVNGSERDEYYELTSREEEQHNLIQTIDEEQLAHLRSRIDAIRPDTVRQPGRKDSIDDEIENRLCELGYLT